MSTYWKVTIYTTLIFTILGVLGNIGREDFITVFIFGVSFVEICIKCLELGKEVENLNTRNKKLKNKDGSITLN